MRLRGCSSFEKAPSGPVVSAAATVRHAFSRRTWISSGSPAERAAVRARQQRPADRHGLAEAAR